MKQKPTNTRDDNTFVYAALILVESSELPHDPVRGNSPPFFPRPEEATLIFYYRLLKISVQLLRRS